MSKQYPIRFRESSIIDNEKSLNTKKDKKKKIQSPSLPSYMRTKIPYSKEGGQIEDQDAILYDPIERSTIYMDLPEFDKRSIKDAFNLYDYDTSFIDQLTNQSSDQQDTDYSQYLNNDSYQYNWYSPADLLQDNTYKSSPGIDNFNKIYDKVQSQNPSAQQFRGFLTKMAWHESRFNPKIKNQAGAPAYGYFQMMETQNARNISTFAKTSINNFLNNPELQINAAIGLANQILRGFSEEDYQLAKQKGITINGMLAGAWLAGNSGVKKYLRGKGNPSDRHWSKSGQGTDVATMIKEFNNI